MPHTIQLYTKQETQTGYWEWDMTGARSFNNYELLEVLGYSGNYADPDTLWRASVIDEDLDAARQKIAEHLSEGGIKPFIQEARCRHLNGSIIHILFAGRSEWDEYGNPVVMK